MIWVETVCDMCYAHCTGMDYKQGCVSSLKAQTKEYGWKFIKGNLYCPECQEWLKNHPNEIPNK